MKKLALAFSSLFALALTACGPVQSPECAQYLECIRAIDADQGTSLADRDESAYGENGTCWSTDAEDAAACTGACADALDGYSTSYPDIEACQPVSTDDA